MDWRHVAACRDEDPELFFPIGTSGPALLQVEQAKAVCRRCDVVDQCLQWALESGQDAGVWGGMSEDERRALKRRAPRARSGMACPGFPVASRTCRTATSRRASSPAASPTTSHQSTYLRAAAFSD